MSFVSTHEKMFYKLSQIQASLGLVSWDSVATFVKDLENSLS